MPAEILPPLFLVGALAFFMFGLLGATFFTEEQRTAAIEPEEVA